MGKILRAMGIVAGLALAVAASTSGVLAQEDETGAAGPARTASAEELAEAILAEVLEGLELPANGGVAIDVPAVSPDLTAANVPTIDDTGGDLGDNPAPGDINVGGSSGGQIMVGGGMGGDVSMGGGAMPAPAPEAPAAPMSGDGGAMPGY